MRCTKAIIYSDNLINNVNEIKKNLKEGVRLCCAVKANAYGNDALNSAKIYESLGAEYLAIATVEEGKELRECGIKTKLLLLSLSDPDDLSDIVKNDITPLAFESEYISLLEKTAAKLEKKCSVFLAIDTGMGRIGCYPEDACKIAKEISVQPHLFLSGTITHFSVSDDISEESIAYTKEQFALFTKAIKSIEDEGLNPGIRTCSASAASIAFPEMQLDMVRPGIILYGYYADRVSKEYLEGKGIKMNLKPVMQLETKVSSIRKIRKNHFVSYGRTWKAKEDTMIAVLPIGYADGLLRRCSPGLLVSINGKAYPVIGRICMDQCMVDLGSTENGVNIWDKAIIFGPKGSGAILDARDIADMTGTIPYEVMTSISCRVKRNIID